MAIRITRVQGQEGQTLLIPTTKEINNRLTAKLEELEQRVAPLSHASINTTYGLGTDTEHGHIKLNGTTAPIDLAETASIGISDKAARADHRHKLPTPQQVGASPKNHADQTTIYGVATEENYGHIRITRDIDNASEDVVLLPSAIKQSLLQLEAELSRAISDKSYFGSYWFAATEQTTNISDILNSPLALSTRLGVTEGIVSLIDFINNRIYSADCTSDTWGNSPLQLEEPVNGTVIGITGYFLDISENTDMLKLSGEAVYSKEKNKWDIYPDKKGGVDNYTIVKNSSGLNTITSYSVRDTTEDALDLENTEFSQSRGYFDWLTAFYRKIRGLHKIKVDKILQPHKLYATDGAGNQLEMPYDSEDEKLPFTVPMRDQFGGIRLPTLTPTEGDQAINYQNLLTHQQDTDYHKSEQDKQKLSTIILDGQDHLFLSQAGNYSEVHSLKTFPSYVVTTGTMADLVRSLDDNLIPQNMIYYGKILTTDMPDNITEQTILKISTVGEIDNQPLYQFELLSETVPPYLWTASGTNGQFTGWQARPTLANIPTQVSQLTNDNGYLVSQSLNEYATITYTNDRTKLATQQYAGLVIGSMMDDRVSIIGEGEMVVNSLNMAKLYQEEGDTIVFNGGNASGFLEINERAY